MKASALGFVAITVTALVACSSDPETPAGTGGSAGVGGKAASVGGSATTTAGTGTTGGGGMGGTTNTTAGTGPATAGTASTAGTTSAGGSAGAASGGTGGATGGTGGTTGGTGVGTGGTGGATGGSGGTAGSSATGGSGNLPNMIPANYTGTPFGGTPQVIPGKIEIEKYDLGGAGVAFQADPGGAFNKCGFMRNDALKLQCTQQAGSPMDKSLPGCGTEPAGQIYLGYIGAGNWYKYTVNVLEAGTYVISGHEGVAGNTQMQFTFTDQVKTGNITLPSTDQCNFEAYHVWAVHQNLGTIALTPGKYVLTINVVAAAMNLDWFEFKKQ
jgi:hypothetical protein